MRRRRRRPPTAREDLWRELGINPDKAWGTINCLALDAKGDLSGITTTSGLAFKIPGRVGDSPLIGCGLYVDNEMGAAGSTGVGEECIKVVGAHMVVEHMRQGMHPREATLAAIKRVLSKHGPNVTWNLNFYAMNKQGQHGGAAIQSGSTYAVHDGTSAKIVESAYVIERKNVLRPRPWRRRRRTPHPPIGSTRDRPALVDAYLDHLRIERRLSTNTARELRARSDTCSRALRPASDVR